MRTSPLPTWQSSGCVTLIWGTLMSSSPQSGARCTHEQLTLMEWCLSHRRFCGSGIAPHCTALYCTALHCTAPHCTAPHRTVLHCTARSTPETHVMCTVCWYLVTAERLAPAKAHTRSTL